MNSKWTGWTKFFAFIGAFAFLMFQGLSMAKEKRDFTDEQDSGASLYAEHCASCHAANGSSNTKRGKRKGAADLRKSRISYAKGIRIISNGKGRMPEFKSVLTSGQIRLVNSHVRGFRRK